MIEYRRSEDRPVTRVEGRTTQHSFSFGAHYDPGNVGFESLVAHNDERLPPGTGYPDHPHADLEVVTWVLSGALRHTSTAGSGVLGPGQVQRLSAGSGVVHSEVSDSDEQTRFLQSWVLPDEPGLVPDYLSADVPSGAGWRRVADGDGNGIVPLAARGVALEVADLAAGHRLVLPDAPRLHVFVVHGRAMLDEQLLAPGDAARLLDEGGRDLSAEEDTQLVVWSFSARGSARPG